MLEGEGKVSEGRLLIRLKRASDIWYRRRVYRFGRLLPLWKQDFFFRVLGELAASGDIAARAKSGLGRKSRNPPFRALPQALTARRAGRKVHLAGRDARGF